MISALDKQETDLTLARGTPRIIRKGSFLLEPQNSKEATSQRERNLGRN